MTTRIFPRLLAGLLALFLLLPLSPAQAAEEEATAQLTRLLANLNSMQASFTQQTTDAKGRTQPTQTGVMSVKRPGLFRWEVQKPSPQTVMTSGKWLWIYDPELMQATRQKLDDQVGNTPALLLSGDPHKLDGAFVIFQELSRADEQVFVLRPHGKEALFDNLRVHFKGNQLLQMELTDTLGQRTDIHFSNVQINPALGASQFEFTPPKGVDVIDQL